MKTLKVFTYEDAQVTEQPPEVAMIVIREALIKAGFTTRDRIDSPHQTFKKQGDHDVTLVVEDER